MYRDADDARRAIGGFIDDVYNRQRLHSALAHGSPIEFEATLRGDAVIATVPFGEPALAVATAG